MGAGGQTQLSRCAKCIGSDGKSMATHLGKATGSLPRTSVRSNGALVHITRMDIALFMDIGIPSTATLWQKVWGNTPEEKG